MNQDLEALIEEHAKIMADQMVKAAAWAGSEEDIRHACNTLIDEFIKKAGLTVEGRHEYGLAGGRIDSKYGGVVIEYKDPKGAGKITEDNNAPGVKAVVEQLKKRFRDFQAKEHVGMERILGVGCDRRHDHLCTEARGQARRRGSAAGHAAYDPTPASSYSLARRTRMFLHP